MGMSDWLGRFIAPTEHLDRAPLLRTEFTLDAGHGSIAEASATLSALGVAEAFIDGSPISADVLTPGWTSYEWRVRYSTSDVTAQLRAAGGDRHALGLALGD